MKEVKDCLYLLMIIQQVIIKFLLILIKNIYFQEQKLKIENVENDGRNFYDQPINDSNNTTKSEKYGQGDDYTVGCLLDFAYF